MVVGVYGTVSYSVGLRTRELGVRMALGARRRDVLRLVVGRGLAVSSIGVLLGLASALALSRVLQGLLFELAPADPATFALAGLLLTMVALLACWLPARRATKVDPAVALRAD